MIVVSDTSPILNISIVGHLGLLRALFGKLVLPPSAAEELARHQIKVPPDWVEVGAAQDREQFAGLARQLDPGEAEAIIVAVELHAPLLLIDEHLGRRVAAERCLEFMGLLGVLSEAKERNLIPACKPLLDAKIERAGFWIGEGLRSRYLLSRGEQP